MDAQCDSGRCLRLLRPLRTHLAALTKAKQQEELHKAEAERTAGLREKRKSEESASAQSPDWLSRALSKKKNLKKQRTYAHRTQDNPPTIPNDEDILPPLNSQLEVPALYIPSQDETTASHTTSNPEPKRLQDRRNNLKRLGFIAAYNEAEVRVVKSYTAILLGTLTTKEKNISSPLTRNTTGAPSLRSMAVRRIPIQLEIEELEQANYTSEERYDPVEDLYEYLDGIAIPKEEGLTFQGHFLRALATHLVLNAIQSRVLDFSTLTNYIEHYGLAMQIKHLPEIDILRHIALGALRPNPRKKNCLQETMFRDIVRLLPLLDEGAQSSKRKAVPSVRTFNAILNNPTIPVEWLATSRFNHHWQNVIIHASSGLGEYHEAAAYINRIVRLSCGIEPLTAAKTYTLKHVSILHVNLNCANCRKNHSGLWGQQTQLQSSFTKFLSSFFSILTSLVLAGVEEYRQRTGFSQEKYKPNLLAIRTLLRSCAQEILDCDYRAWGTDQAYNDFYRSRCIIVLFSVLLSRLPGPMPESYAELDWDQLVGLIKRFGKLGSRGPESPISNELADQLASICLVSSQISGGTAETFLQYISGSINVSTSFSHRTGQFLQQICRSASLKLNPNTEVEEEQANDPDNFDENQDSTTNNRPEERDTPIRSRNTNIMRSPFHESSQLTCSWDAMIDEWVALTPARPSWASSQAVMNGSNILDTNDQDDTLISDDGEESFSSQEDTLVENVEDDTEELLSSPFKATRKSNATTGRISDLINSSSPIATSKNSHYITRRSTEEDGSSTHRRDHLSRTSQRLRKRSSPDATTQFVSRKSARLSAVDDTKHMRQPYKPRNKVEVVIYKARPKCKVEVIIHGTAHSNRARPSEYSGEEDELA
jgi:hypothetical protein